MPTVTLATRFGHARQNPSDEDLVAALAAVYVEDHPALTEADYEEHPSAWLDYGYENEEKWSVYTMDVYRTGTVLLTKMEDQDDDAPESEKRMENVRQEKALHLWGLLKDGRIDDVLKKNWMS